MQGTIITARRPGNVGGFPAIMLKRIVGKRGRLTGSDLFGSISKVTVLVLDYCKVRFLRQLNSQMFNTP